MIPAQSEYDTGTSTCYPDMDASASPTAVIYVSCYSYHDEYLRLIDDIDGIILEAPVEMPIPLWPELYEDAPHRVPNHYPPAPRKIEARRQAPAMAHKVLKQPVARAGFKRGQRRTMNEKNS